MSNKNEHKTIEHKKVELFDSNIFHCCNNEHQSCIHTVKRFIIHRFLSLIISVEMIMFSKFNQCSPVVLLMFCLVVPCNIAILFGDYTHPIDQYSSNIFHNILRMKPYNDHIISKFLNTNDFYTSLSRLTKYAFRR